MLGSTRQAAHVNPPLERDTDHFVAAGAASGAADDCGAGARADGGGGQDGRPGAGLLAQLQRALLPRGM